MPNFINRFFQFTSLFLLNLTEPNVTNFIKDGGKVVVCGVCLRVAGFEPDDVIDEAIIGTDEITPKIFTNSTVVTY